MDIIKIVPLITKRNYAVDNARGILIILVVIGHIGFIEGFWTLNQLIYLFHMPAFFAIGLVFVKPFSIQFLKDRAKRLLLPYLFYLSAGNNPSELYFDFGPKLFLGHQNLKYLQWLWLLLGCVTIGYYLYLQIVNPKQHLGNYLIWLYAGLVFLRVVIKVIVEPGYFLTYCNQLLWSNWSHIYSPFWFLPAMFCLSILGALLIKVKWQWQIAMFSFISFLLVLPQLIKWHDNIPWGLDVAWCCLPLGYCFQIIYKNRSVLLAWGTPLIRNIVLGLAFGIMLAGCYFIIPDFNPEVDTQKVEMVLLNLPRLELPLVFLLAICFWAFMLTLSNKSIFCEIGTKTMPIFTLHYPLLFVLKSYQSSFSFLHPYLQYALVTCVAIALPYLLALVYQRIDKRFAYLGLA